MIGLEHVNLVVKDIAEMLKFYQAAFPHWKIRDQGQGTWSGKPRNWMHFGDDYQYLAFSDHGEGENRDLSGPRRVHTLRVTNNIDAVISRLLKAGYPIAKDGADDPYRKNIYFLDPAGFEVEFVEYLSDEPKLRNLSS